MSVSGWPSVEQFQRMGLVRCQTDGCTVFVDPVNVPSRQCLAHQRAERQRRREQRFQNRPRISREHRRAA